MKGMELLEGRLEVDEKKSVTKRENGNDKGTCCFEGPGWGD